MGCDSENPRQALKRQFFGENINTKQNENESFNFKNMKSKVKLEFAIENIEINHKYKIECKFFEPYDTFSTETVLSNKNLIIFNACHICNYYFEKRQNMQISLIKDFQNKGTVQVSLGQIVGSPGSSYRQLIDQSSFIIVTAEGITDTNSYIEFNLSAQNNSNFDFKNISDRISYCVISNKRKIYSSESISMNGNFDKIKIPSYLLDKGFTVSFLNSKQEELAYKDETIESFTSPNQNIYLGLNINKKKLNIINHSSIVGNISFIDYIKKGVTIKLNIGIDFTSSNKPPGDPTSFHYLYGNSMNDYEQAIRQCGMTVAYYDCNQLFPVYGFGAAIGNIMKSNDCFNINFRDNPEIQTIDNVIKEYRNCFKNIILAGPTNFCPVIRKVIDNIKAQNNQLKYHILLLLTDGIIYDMKETIDALVEGSFLPLSVIIIGIGDDPFKEMIILDGDNVPLFNSRGVKRMRDLVQFVPFNKYKNNPNKLMEQVLEEVPRQVVEYYTMNNIYPQNLSMARINNGSMMNNSQQIFYQPNIYQSNRNNYNNIGESGYSAGGGIYS